MSVISPHPHDCNRDTPMTGAKLKYRHLGRDTAHRISLLRNLVTSLIEHESIVTTYPKAKEAQREVEKCITLGKRGTDAARRSAMARIFVLPPRDPCFGDSFPFHPPPFSANSSPQQRPEDILPKLFGPLAQRYSNRPGGYTRVLRVEPKDKYDQAPSAILELVDGQREMKFSMVAMTIARCAREEKTLSAITVDNIKKLTKFRPDGEAKLMALVERLKSEDAVIHGVGERERRARTLLEGGKKVKGEQGREKRGLRGGRRR